MSRARPLFRRIPTPAVVLAGIVAVALGAGAALQAVSPPTYTVTAQLSALPRAADTPSASIIRLLAGTYVGYGGSDAVAAKVAQVTGAPAATVAEAISINMSSLGANIGLTVTTSSRSESSSIAKEVLRLLSLRAAADETLAITVADVSSSAVSDESKRLRVMAYVLLGLSLVILIAVAWELWRRRRMSAEGWGKLGHLTKDG